MIINTICLGEASFTLKNNKNTPVDSNVKWTDKIFAYFSQQHLKFCGIYLRNSCLVFKILRLI